MTLAAIIARWRGAVPAVIAVTAAVIALLAVEAVRAAARDLTAAELRTAIASIPAWRLAIALGFTALSYFALSLYDGLALTLMGKPLPWRLTAPTAFVSYAISNSLGLALITGGSVRYGRYARSGLAKSDIVRLTLLCSGAFWTGLVLFCGLVLILAPTATSAAVPVVLAPDRRVVGTMLLLAVAAIWALLLGTSRRRSGWLSDPPAANLRTLVLFQLATLFDLACAGGAMVVLLGADSMHWPDFALAYAIALSAGAISHVPGGLGVFDVTFLALAPVSTGAGLAALLVYRLCYYVVPLALALMLQVVQSGAGLLGPARQAAAIVGRMQRMVTPAAAAILSMVSGMVLLLSIATPAIPGRLRFLTQLVPDTLVNTSHFLASLVGTGLLLLGPALNARLRSAFVMSIILLVAGAFLALTKGLDYEEAIVLLVIAGLIQSSSAGFYRTAGLGSAPFDVIFWGIMLAVLATAMIALVLSHDGLIAQESWWSAEFGQEATRSVRGLVAAALLLGLVGFRQILVAPPPSKVDPLPPGDVLERSLVAAERSDAMLAFTGDKQFLISDAGDAFLMYRVHGRTWTAMGDPVGPEERWPELTWRLREAADRTAGLVCFYEVSERMLPLLVDLGLATKKYGEEAVIDLAGDFRLPKGVRSAMRRVVRQEIEFAILPAAEVPQWTAQLKSVSDEWLRGKAGEEKCFSLGRFDPTYLARFDCAIARRGDDLLAFANIWAMPNRHEMSIDLMRQRSAVPNGTMDFLIGRCIEHAAAAGFARFSLGMTPLAGLTARPLAPHWAQIGATVYRRGNRYYGFSGLRAFKEKFRPRWESRYVATAHGLNGWRALIDTARLIGA
ncbi:MAG: bifunctional lysylphosphatidylglycerol flippase/synthetase MprF [Sphingomicrobium sp.]